ncbi:MAG TPA: hypothetical protein VF665_23320 [Longimicrobium sp.]|jgi:hypothetical protein|uniref:hypothetical protein n=1 Tax=Longimicrobium sp. TaxID=2029185 RepID=UPI002ED831BE
MKRFIAAGALAAAFLASPVRAEEEEQQLYECVTTTTTTVRTITYSDGSSRTDTVTTVRRVCTPI